MELVTHTHGQGKGFKAFSAICARALDVCMDHATIDETRKRASRNETSTMITFDIFMRDGRACMVRLITVKGRRPSYNVFVFSDELPLLN